MEKWESEVVGAEIWGAAVLTPDGALVWDPWRRAPRAKVRRGPAGAVVTKIYMTSWPKGLLQRTRASRGKWRENPSAAPHTAACDHSTPQRGSLPRQARERRRRGYDLSLKTISSPIISTLSHSHSLSLSVCLSLSLLLSLCLTLSVSLSLALCFILLFSGLFSLDSPQSSNSLPQHLLPWLLACAKLT